MSDEVIIRRIGRAGRITLNRPQALNALSYGMCTAIEAALDQWAVDDSIDLLIVDATGDRAFCAGGDIAEMYRSGRVGDFDYGRRFWADEYRLNAKIHNYSKPYIAFMQGFTMGGGVGIGCHGSHRIVGETSRMAMPECGIGLIPDVGGSWLLALAPGRMGEYLGCTGARMGPGDAIHGGFADAYITQDRWTDLIAGLEVTGDAGLLAAATQPAPDSPLAALQADIDVIFRGETIADILLALEQGTGDFTKITLAALRRQSPLSAACSIQIIHRARAADRIEQALNTEYRFTYRAAEQSDFLEGIRAAIIHKDKNPIWRDALIEDVSAAQVDAMLAPLGANALDL